MSEGKMTFTQKLEHNAKFRAWIMRGLVAFCLVMFFGFLYYGASDLLGREGTLPPPMSNEIVAPESREEIYAYVQAAIDKTLEEKPMLVYGTDFGLDTGSIEFSGNGAARLRALARLLAPDIEGQMREGLPNGTTEFGESIAELLWGIAMPAQAELDFIYYRCICGQNANEVPDVCERCHDSGGYTQRFRDNYTITLRYEDPAAIAALFRPRTEQESLALLGALEGFAEIERLAWAYNEENMPRVVAVVNRFDGKLHSLRFERHAIIDMGLLVNEDFDAAGSVSFAARLRESTEFGFTWPGVSFNHRERTLDLRERSQLQARVNGPLWQETPLVWASSNPDIVTVDQEGYLRAGREYGTALITASFELNGVTHTAEATVNVRVSVEKITLSSRSLRMSTGGTHQLSETVSPRNATVREVDWYTEDASVATVDENGLVTAIAPGSTVVYAVTRDGWFLATCTVTVGGGR